MNSIAIGDGITITKDFELCIKTESFELRGTMTVLEHEYISSFLLRTCSMGGLKFKEQSGGPNEPHT